MARVLIFDGRHLLYRTADAFSNLFITWQGKYIPTGAMYGFLNVITRIYSMNVGVVVIAWEGTNNFRYALYPQYKGKRGITEADRLIRENVKTQENNLKEILSLLGIYQFSGFKCEADDVIGTIAKKMAAKGRDVLVYSGDGDLRQLVGPRILIMSPGHKGKERIYGFEDVVNKDGVEPRQIPDLKALAGDSSDNIPGIRGVGKKTASTLVYTYGDVESILLAAKKSDDWPVSERFLEPILDDSENIRLYKQLATIKTDVKLLPISQKRDFKEFVKLLYRYRFMSFINKKKLGLFRRMAMYEICHENNI